MTRKKKPDVDFEQECRRIASKNLGKIEAWLDRLGKENPEAAIKMWVHISEFAHAKKARDSEVPPRMNVNILMEPAQRRPLQQPEDNYIDISESQKEKDQNE